MNFNGPVPKHWSQDGYHRAHSTDINIGLLE